MNNWKTEWERRQPREIPPRPRPPGVSRRAAVLVLVIVLLVLALAVLYYIPITYGT